VTYSSEHSRADLECLLQPGTTGNVHLVQMVPEMFMMGLGTTQWS